MAQAHARMGIKVTMVEAMQILGKDDPELVEFLRRRLQKEGIGSENEAGVKQKDGDIIVRLHDGRDSVGIFCGHWKGREYYDPDRDGGIAFGPKVFMSIRVFR